MPKLAWVVPLLVKSINFTFCLNDFKNMQKNMILAKAVKVSECLKVTFVTWVD
jgi:hypothetical protein